jgi:hypothetical protein
MVIDLHAHFVPRAFLEAIEKEGAQNGASLRRDGKDQTMVVGGRPYGPITRHYFETRPRIAEMDKTRVDMQVLSLCPPMVYWADGDLGPRLARTFNDELAAAVDEEPDRLAGLATVPLQDVAAARSTVAGTTAMLAIILSRVASAMTPASTASCMRCTNTSARRSLSISLGRGRMRLASSPVSTSARVRSRASAEAGIGCETKTRALSVVGMSQPQELSRRLAA